MRFTGGVQHLATNGSGTVVLPPSSSLRPESGGSLTIDAGIVVQGTGGTVGELNLALFNEGLIQGVSGTTLVTGSGWMNQGTGSIETSGGELFSTWNSEACRGLMKGVPLSVRLVVDNPSDLFITLTRVTPKVWLTGRETSVGAVLGKSQVGAPTAVDAAVDGGATTCQRYHIHLGRVLVVALAWQ